MGPIIPQHKSFHQLMPTAAKSSTTILVKYFRQRQVWKILEPRIVYRILPTILIFKHFVRSICISKFLSQISKIWMMISRPTPYSIIKWVKTRFNNIYFTVKPPDEKNTQRISFLGNFSGLISSQHIA